MSNDLLIACMYTSGSAYAEEARELAASAARFGYHVEAIEIADQGDWWRNVGIKPRLILEAFRSHEGPLLSLDADCRILQPLDEMLALLDNADVAVKHRPNYCFTALFNAAVLLLNKTPATLSLVETWAERGDRYAFLHRFAEQGAFAEGMLYTQGNLRFCNLPGKFHVDPRDGAAGPDDDSVIFHRKASNRARKTALPEAPPPMPTTAPPKAVFVALRPRKSPSPRGLLMWGADAAMLDFKEYASRYGMSGPATSIAPTPENHPAALIDFKISVLGELNNRLPSGTPVVLADYDVVLLGDPRVYWEPLEEADVVVAWDIERADAIPSLNVIGIRTGPRIESGLLPAIEQENRQLRGEYDPEQALGCAFAVVLRDPPAGIRVVPIAGHHAGDLATATRATVALSARGAMQLNSGEPKCSIPTWHQAQANRRAATG